MHPFGCNAINDRTIGESAQGLAEYVRETVNNSEQLSCAIAYDTRINSRHFAELCAGIMVGNGFKVYFLDIISKHSPNYLIWFDTKIAIVGLWSRPATIRLQTTR